MLYKLGSTAFLSCCFCGIICELSLVVEEGLATCTVTKHILCVWNSKKLVLACLLSEYLHNFKFTWGSSTLLLAAAFWRSRGDPELLSEMSQNLWTPLQTGMHKFWLYHLHLWQRAFEPNLTSNSLVCLRTMRSLQYSGRFILIVLGHQLFLVAKHF